jgi:hypothetical protein
MRSDADLRKSFEASGIAKGIPFWTEPRACADMERSEVLREVLADLPRTLDVETYEGRSLVEETWSSYKDHGYGHLFYSLVRTLKPRRCVELGVLQGFSLLTTASALRDNASGKIEGYDLFEDYPYHNAKEADVQAKIDAAGLTAWASIKRADAFSVHEAYESADMLHVDVSNNGDVFSKTFSDWSTKISSAILFEGGGKDRDQVEWMSKYNKPPILPAIETLRSSYPEWEITVFEPYPSLTIAIRKDAGRET